MRKFAAYIKVTFSTAKLGMLKFTHSEGQF